MENYNRLISSKMLGNVENMLGEVPQPTMFGGKRQRDFVLPSSSNYSYPASLAVGHLGTSGMPKTLGASFWTDFGETNFLQDAEDDPVEGGAYHIGATGEVYRSNQLPSKIGGKMTAKKFFKGAAPIAKELGMTLAKEAIKEGVKQGFKPQGGKMSAKKFFKGVAPVAKDFGMILAKEGIKEGVKQGAKGGRVTKEFFEAERELLPKGKKALEEFLKGAGQQSGFIQAMVAKKPSVSKYSPFNLSKVKNPSADLTRRYAKKAPAKKKKFIIEEDEDEAEEYLFEPKKSRGRPRKKIGAGYQSEEDSEEDSDEECEGGVLLRDVPSQFHSSVYPPSLQSYTATKDAYGRGKVKGGARAKSARGAIVSEVMKKHGLSLPEASKFVKQNNLY